MYEDDELRSGATVNETAGQNAGQSSNSYFDYTTYSTEDLNQKADVSKAERRKQDKAEKKAAKAERKAAKKGRPFRKFVLSVSLGLCFGLFAGVGFYGVQWGTGQLTGNNTKPAVSQEAASTTESVQQTPALTTTTQVTYVQDDISGVVENVMPAMVSIVNQYTTTTRDFWGQSYEKESAASGSGIIVAETDSELLIVSNNHVVEGATKLEVTFIDGSTAEASIKGEPVIAIGNAVVYGQSVTNGIVSALNREISLEDGSTGTFIQTNAAINPGNSGGALLNIRGEVIGINSNKIGGTTVEGMGYAIPISSASPIIADLMERQTRNKVADDEVGYMGITMQDITEQIVQMYNMPEGVFVYDVAEGSAAEAAGIKNGDIIVKFDGQKVSSASDIKNVIQYYKAGDTATITVKRAMNGEYESIDLEITFGTRPEN